MELPYETMSQLNIMCYHVKSPGQERVTLCLAVGQSGPTDLPQNHHHRLFLFLKNDLFNFICIYIGVKMSDPLELELQTV